MENAIKFLQDHLSTYVETIIQTMTHPGLQFRVNSESEEGSLRLGSLNPQLWSFAITSILIGSVIFAVAEGETDIPGLIETFLALALIVLWFWIMYGVYAHILCRMFHGKAGFTATLAISLQVLSIAYVISAFVAFTLSLFINLFWPDANVDLSIPYLVSQFALISIYLPPALRGAHDLSLRQQVALTILLPMAVLMTNIFLFYLAVINISPIRVHK